MNYFNNHILVLAALAMGTFFPNLNAKADCYERFENNHLGGLSLVSFGSIREHMFFDRVYKSKFRVVSDEADLDKWIFSGGWLPLTSFEKVFLDQQNKIHDVLSKKLSQFCPERKLVKSEIRDNLRIDTVFDHDLGGYIVLNQNKNGETVDMFFVEPVFCSYRRTDVENVMAKIYFLASGRDYFQGINFWDFSDVRMANYELGFKHAENKRKIDFIYQIDTGGKSIMHGSKKIDLVCLKVIARHDK